MDGRQIKHSERVDAAVDDRAGEHERAEFGELAPAVTAAAGGRRLRTGRGEIAPGDKDGIRGREDQRRKQEDERAFEPEQRDRRAGHRRPDREAHAAAEREHAEICAAVAFRRKRVDEHRRLRVEHGDPHAADDDSRAQSAIARYQSRRRHAAAGHADAEQHHPSPRLLIAEPAEQRLNE